jgi:serine/threonine protein kinase
MTIQTGAILQGRYQVIRQIGGGGFGQIFEVNDNGISKVLKVLNLKNFNHAQIKNKATILFRREAELLIRLRHPGIPSVDACGYFTWNEAGGEPLQCLVMEKIPGQNLQQWLSARGNKPIANEDAIAWLTQLVKILDVLHRENYFHRDIKPTLNNKKKMQLAQ